MWIYVSHTGKLVVLVMVLSAISLIGAILCIHLTFKQTPTRVPRFIRVVAFHGLAKVLLLAKVVPDDETHTEKIDHGGKPGMEQEVDSTESDLKMGMELVVKELRFITQQMRLRDEEDARSSEWKLLAKIVDRLLFWICFIASLIVIIAIYA